jgi:ribose-phosphate pyrophosphokinase
LNGLDLFREIFNNRQKDLEAIVVSTDAGGAKATIHLAKALDIDYAITNKYRPQKEKADLLGVIGFLDDKKIAIITDDETVTFSSLMNAVKILSQDYKIREIYVAVSHMKLSPEKIPLLKKANETYNLKEIHFTDSVPQVKEILELPFVRVHSLDERFALTINNLHYNRSVSRLFYKPTEK